MNNKSNYNKSFDLNHKQDFYLMNNYEDGLMESDNFNSDYVNLDDNIDFEKDQYFDNLQNSTRKFSFPDRKGYVFKQDKYK